MDDILKNAYDPESFRNEGHKLIDQIADYLNYTLKGKEMKILPWMKPCDQHEDWKNYLEDGGNIQDYYKKVLDQSIHLHHPKYIGHQVVPPVPMAALTEILATISNNGMAIYEMGPAATAIERVVIEWLLSFIGWENDSNGIITSGGSLGNLTALLAARQATENYDVWEKGVSRDLAVMVSEESHYSVDRSIKIMGLGENGVIKLPVKNHRIEVDKLPDLLQKVREQGRNVISLVGNACSTSTGIYDPIDELADFCNENKIWFHIDGAHGGAVITSKKYKHLVKGIEKADSIVIDFHKMMLTPALTTAVLFKNGNTSYEAFAQKASYLLDKNGEIPWYDGAGRSIECTKKAMALKVYLMIKFYGDKLFEQYVDTTYDVSREFANKINNRSEYELAIEPESNIVCFRYKPEGFNEIELNDLNKKIRKEIIESGTYYIVQTEIEGKVFLRLTIMNPFTKITILEELLNIIPQFK